MKYTIYDEGGDTEIFERPDGTREKNEFVFAGFSNKIHPYHKKQTEWAVEMLKSVGVPLFIKEVSTVDKIGRNADNGEFEIEDLYLSDIIYKIGNRNLILIQDTEMGRGWAVLLEINPKGEMKIITQDHRDTVRDQTLLDSKWLGKAGVQLERKTVKSLDILMK
jgi:hypothetical protein